MPRIVSIARSRPTRSSTVRCCDTSGGAPAVSVAIWRRHPFLSERPQDRRRRARRPGVSVAKAGWSSIGLQGYREPGIGFLPMRVESLWWPRLRWRLRGAWQWTTFIALTLLDTLVIALLPFYGEGPDALGAFLLAVFVNLVPVAVAAPVAGLVLVRRRPDLPRLVARDYGGTAMLMAAAVGLVVARLAHRSDLGGERAA